MKAPANCRLIGRWRIVEADIWDRAYLNLCGPATLTITAQGGEIAFGALEAGLEVEYARDSIGFRWAGCDEGDEVEGEGTAELLDDGTIEIEFAYRQRRRSRPQSETRDFFNSLLSCSPSRGLSKHRHSGSAQALCFWTTSTAGGRAVRRRLSKLSCAGWLPHDRGFVSELPLSRRRASA